MPASSAVATARPGHRPAIGHRAKRWLFVVHRWIGIATCLLFAIWFVSGLVMIYVPFPALTQAERMAGLPRLAFDRVALDPAAAARMAGVAAPERVALEMAGSAPVWRVRDWEGGEHAIWARDGRPVAPVAAGEAARIAEAFAHRRVVAVEAVTRDQWTVAGGYDRHRPLWKAYFAGPGGHVLYVSSRTGAVVLDTDARERMWNWLGSIPHWIYPTVLRQNNAAWRQVVMWVSFPCILAAITGMWIGLLRVRLGQRRFKGGRTIPYHGWMAWHHVAGLFGGVALLAWIFSGWLSVDPFRLFASPGIGTAEERAYAGADRPMPAIGVGAVPSRLRDAVRIEWRWAAGVPLMVVEAPGRPAQVLDADRAQPVALGLDRIAAAARRLKPGESAPGIERLTQPDAYWYGVGEPPLLPVLRLRYPDAAGTWVHIDPATGEVLNVVDRRRRVYRWAFDFLHKWDLPVLLAHRPAWDAVLWLLSLLGLVTSVSGIWIGWRRLRRPQKYLRG